MLTSWVQCSFIVSYTKVKSGESGTIAASSLFIATGILGGTSTLNASGRKPLFANNITAEVTRALLPY